MMLYEYASVTIEIEELYERETPIFDLLLQLYTADSYRQDDDRARA